MLLYVPCRQSNLGILQNWIRNLIQPHTKCETSGESTWYTIGLQNIFVPFHLLLSLIYVYMSINSATYTT